MIKICVTLNEGQGQYILDEMHSHVRGSHCAKCDDDDLNSVRETTSEGQTYRQTHTRTRAHAHTHTYTHTHTHTHTHIHTHAGTHRNDDILLD